MKKILTLAFLLLIAIPTSASASPLLYTIFGTGSGSLGTTTFLNALVTITMTGDTATAPSSGSFQTYAGGPVSLTVAGVGTTTISGASVFVNQLFAPPAEGFGITGLGSILDAFSAAFATHNLNTPIGPITGASFIRPDLTFPTGLGGFNILTMGNVTYSVTDQTTVPEPSSLITMVLGFGSVAIAIRRAKARSAKA